MAIPAAAWALGSAAVGLLGSKSANKPRVTTNTSQTTPYGGNAGLDNLLDLQEWGLGHALQNAQYGPNELQNQVYNQLLGGVGGGFSPIGIPGGDGIGAEFRGYGHGPELPTAVGLSPEEIAQFAPEVSALLQREAEGHLLGSNPYTDRMISGMRDDAIRNFRETEVASITSDFAGAGRTGSSAYGTALGRANAEFQGDLGDRMATIRYQNYNDERARQLQALGLISDETNISRGLLGQLRNADLSSATSIRNANTAANVGLYGADLNASIAQASLAQQAAIASNQFGLAASQDEWARLLGAYGVGEQHNQAVNQGALLPLGIIGDFTNMYAPLIGNFGTTRSSGTTPGAGINPWGAALQGAAGGLSTAYGLGQFGTGAATGATAPAGAKSQYSPPPTSDAVSALNTQYGAKGLA